MTLHLDSYAYIMPCHSRGSANDWSNGCLSSWSVGLPLGYLLLKVTCLNLCSYNRLSTPEHYENFESLPWSLLNTHVMTYSQSSSSLIYWVSPLVLVIWYCSSSFSDYFSALFGFCSSFHFLKCKQSPWSIFSYRLALSSSQVSHHSQLCVQLL